MMEALQGDIARQINKRSYPDSDSESDTDHLHQERKRTRHAHKPRLYTSRSHNPPILDSNTRVSPSLASSSTLVGDNNKQNSSPARSQFSSIDESSDKESLHPSTEPPSESTLDEIGIREESNATFPTASNLSTESDSVSSFSEDSDDLGDSDSEHKEAEPTVINVPYRRPGQKLSIHISRGDVQVERVPMSSDHSGNGSKSTSTDDEDTSQSSSDTKAPSSDSDNDSSSLSESDSDPHDDTSQNSRGAEISSTDSDIGSSSSESNTDSDSDSDSVLPLEVASLTRTIAPIHQAFPSKAQSYPNTSNPSFTSRDPSLLQARLDSLLPQIRAANEELEVEEREGRLGDRDIERLADGEKAHIEMELGLGVLEEKKVREEREGYGAMKTANSDGSAEKELAHERVLPALLPNGRTRDTIGIEVVEDEL